MNSDMVAGLLLIAVGIVIIWRNRSKFNNIIKEYKIQNELHRIISTPEWYSHRNVIYEKYELEKRISAFFEGKLKLTNNEQQILLHEAKAMLEKIKNSQAQKAAI